VKHSSHWKARAEAADARVKELEAEAARRALEAQGGGDGE